MSDYIQELSGIVGDKNVIFDRYSIDYYSVKGVKPRLIVNPGSVSEISEIVKFCSIQGLSLSPAGNGTKLHIGNRPSRLDLVLRTSRLGGLTEHYQKDFIATAGCGMTLQDFQNSISKSGQFLPLDPPHMKYGATLGGIIATNDYGPSRGRYGTCRELLLEIKFIRADGELIRGGAKVVKNVAGYDIPKLLTGSLGTLGIMVESTFRLYPLPETSKTIAATYNDLESLDLAIESVMAADIVPTSVEVTNSALSERISGIKQSHNHGSYYNLYIKIENTEKAVNAQLKTIAEILGYSGPGNCLEGNQEYLLWDNIANFAYNGPEDNLVIKASVLLRNVTKVLNYLNQIQTNLELGIECSGRITNGIVFISLTGDTKNQLIAAELLRSHVSSLEGNVTVLKCPPGMVDDIDIWGDMGSSFGIMKKIKYNFDPMLILNPGRLIPDM